MKEFHDLIKDSPINYFFEKNLFFYGFSRKEIKMMKVMNFI